MTETYNQMYLEQLMAEYRERIEVLGDKNVPWNGIYGNREELIEKLEEIDLKFKERKNQND